MTSTFLTVMTRVIPLIVDTMQIAEGAYHSGRERKKFVQSEVPIHLQSTLPVELLRDREFISLIGRLVDLIIEIVNFIQFNYGRKQNAST